MEAERVGLREGAQPHERLDHGDPGLLDQGAEFLGGLARHDAATGVDNGLPGLPDGGGHILYLVASRPQVRVIAPYGDLLGPHGHIHRLLDILGHVHKNRPGTPCTGNVEGLLDLPWDIFDAVDKEVVLGDLSCDLDDGRFLEGVSAHQVRGHLPGYGNDGHGVHFRVGQARDQIGRARAGCGQANAYLAGGLGIALRGKYLALLVSAQDVADLGAGDRLVEFHTGATGVAENGLDPLTRQCLDQYVGALDRFAALRIRARRFRGLL